MLGRPRLHLRRTDSTNRRARELAGAGAPHGTLVTAGEQSEGRGRQGRTWSAPPGQGLLLSLVLRDFDDLLPLRAGVAVADVAGPQALVKWPNDVLLDQRKVAGVLVEGRPQEGWAVVGIGVNVAVDVRALPPDVNRRATSLGRRPDEIERTLQELLRALDARLRERRPDALTALRDRDALLGREVSWSGGRGVGAGIDGEGNLVVRKDSGEIVFLRAGEVHLGPPPGKP